MVSSMKKQPETPALSRRERQVMDILHKHGEATVAEIMADLPDPPTYSAVRSVLRILGEKQLIRFKEDGPRYVYYPAQSTEVAREELALARSLESYRPDLAPVWSRYWQDVILSAAPMTTPTLDCQATTDAT